MNTTASATDDDRAQVTALFERYIEAWNAGDLQQIGADIYETPVCVYEPGGTSTLATPEAIVTLLGGLRQQLAASGFVRSTLEQVATCDLGGGLMFASFHYRRHFVDASGRKTDDVLASAYILRKLPTGWRLAAHVLQATLYDLVFLPDR